MAIPMFFQVRIVHPLEGEKTVQTKEAGQLLVVTQALEQGEPVTCGNEDLPAGTSLLDIRTDGGDCVVSPPHGINNIDSYLQAGA